MKIIRENLKPFKKIAGVYVLKNIVNGKKYVGQSKNLYKRIDEYIRGWYTNPHFKYAVQHYGFEKFEIESITICDIDDLDYLETSLIKIYDTMNPEKGYNKTSGGNAQKIISEETRKKFSLINSGKNNPNFGKPRSEETKRKMSETQQQRTLETRIKLSNSQKKKPLIGINLKTKQEIYFCSGANAERKGFEHWSEVIAGKRKYNKGFIFRYATEEEIKKFSDPNITY